MAHDGQPYRRWPVWLLGARFVVGAVAVYAGYVLLVDWSRFVEAGAVGRLLEPLSSGKVDADFARGEGLLYVDTGGGEMPFAARVTRSCTVLTPVAIVIWVALCATRGPLRRRILGLAASVAVLVAFDLARISLVIVAGARWGTDVMVLTHDWVGTLMTLVALVLGILVLWGVGTSGRGRRSAPAVLEAS